ncbi:uncharacterized protein LOC112590169 [Harpegnathos saltator]|uniref:uncharacterized protein LOC112590169 n=1 Tax=Harpegnathos saltator TaxID=610380 RepID=UPI000DBEDB18|nr:uncharacterized protein LOC112590169 [Harpegnathos saltator]
MRAGCHIELPREIKMKRAVISVQSKDNACFAWAVVAALCPADKHADRQSSYPHYTSVLNMHDIEFPMRINQIKKFERLNNISINIHSVEKRYNNITKKEGNVVAPIRLTEQKMEKHVNLLHIPNPRDDDDNAGHFAWIKNLSRLISSQLSKKEHKKHICDRCLHYFSSSEKLESHTVDCEKMNNCALPNDDNKWLSFTNYCRKERVLFVVYADLECILEKAPREKQTSSYAYQHHSFIDSYKFLSSSLDKLASFLNHDKLKIVRSEFSNLSDMDFDLLTRKGVFPYEYLDCADKLQDQCLPPRESFYSSLTGDTVSENDYAHAVNIWRRFSIQTLGEYSDLYLKTDVLLLADIFENFRNSCIKSYGLDPAYYYTSPGFTWDAMLKHTGVNFELLTDIDIVMFIERGIRGGLSQCSGRYAKANNKYM